MREGKVGGHSVVDLCTMLLNHGLTLFGEHIGYAELIGQVFALVVVLLARRRSLWTWPVQLLSVLLLFIVYVTAHLGGLAARQVVVGLIALYGWHTWIRRRDPLFGVVVRRATARERITALTAVAVGTVGFALLLQATNASWAPWPDAAIFTGTVAAFVLQGVGVVEFWPMWLIVDAVGIPLQLASGLWFSASVYAFFAVLVLQGWHTWTRTVTQSSTARSAF